MKSYFKIGLYFKFFFLIICFRIKKVILNKSLNVDLLVIPKLGLIFKIVSYPEPVKVACTESKLVVDDPGVEEDRQAEVGSVEVRLQQRTRIGRTVRSRRTYFGVTLIRLKSCRLKPF